MERMIDRILSCIREHPEGIDNESIRQILNGKHHSQISFYCYDLEAKGLIEHKSINGVDMFFPKDNFSQDSQAK